MPKSFLMSGKRRDILDMVHKKEDDSENDMRESPSPDATADQYSYNPSSPESEPVVPVSPTVKSPPQFSPSPESAFNKIERTQPDPILHKPQLSPPIPASTRITGLYPGLYPPLFPYPVGSMTGENGAHAALPSMPYPPMTLASAGEKRDSDSPDKNMFYYVDPRIPFTNYFLNLTRLLNNNANSKNCPATTPLGKMTAGDENRADDREPPMTPESPKQTNVEDLRKSRKRKHSSDESNISSTHVQTSERLSVDTNSPNMDIGQGFDRSGPSGLINTRTISDPSAIAAPIPFGSPLLSTAQFTGSHNSPLLPLATGSSMFHPALMQMHAAGAGYRRYNPEKPAPVKKYKCDVCGKAFSRSNTLVTHKRIHTGDKPFKCEICSRAFRQPGNLTRHRLTHTTVKPYVCPTCNKAFNRASNLHTHMRTHTSFKAFVCPYCGKGFHQKIDMKIHCYTHTAHVAPRPDIQIPGCRAADPRM